MIAYMQQPPRVRLRSVAKFGTVKFGAVKFVIALLCALITVLAPASAAQAHAESSPAASDYVTRLTEIAPAVTGLSVAVVQNGTRLQLTNHTGRTIEVLGYGNEPYLRITPGGTYANTASSSVYVNGDLGTAQQPDNVNVGPAAAAHWRKLGDTPTIRWHDHRTHWMSKQQPPIVRQSPDRQHRIRAWKIALRIDGGQRDRATFLSTTGVSSTRVELRGTLDYLPPPQTHWWWAGMLGVVCAIVVLIATMRRITRGTRATSVTLGGLLILAAAAELIDSVGRALDAGAAGLGLLTQVLTTETYGTLAALAAVAAAVLALRNHPSAPFTAGLSAMCLAVLGALTDVAVFSQGHVAVPWSSELARLCTAATLALGVGVAVAAWLAAFSLKPPAESPF